MHSLGVLLTFLPPQPMGGHPQVHRDHQDSMLLPLKLVTVLIWDLVLGLVLLCYTHMSGVVKGKNVST